MSDETTTLSHQALKKGELRTLVNEFEQRTLEMIERSMGDGIAAGILRAQVGGRIDFLVRLQMMDLTCTPIEWSAIRLAWRAREAA